MPRNPKDKNKIEMMNPITPDQADTLGFKAVSDPETTVRSIRPSKVSVRNSTRPAPTLRQLSVSFILIASESVRFTSCWRVFLP